MNLLTSSQVKAVEDEIFRADVAILAAEDWSEEYNKDPKSHARLIKGEAGLLRTMRRYFRTLSDDVDKFVSWSAYNHAIQYQQTKQINADGEDQFSVEVIVRDLPIEESDDTFLKVIFDDLVTMAAAGALAGENIYDRYIGMTTTNAQIQRYAREQAASLVGKRLDSNGNIIDNPNAKYRISETTRKDIRESIRTSLNLGEDQETARDRLRSVIKNPARAELIAQTEAVNAFQGGLLEFGNVTGAVGKESQSVGAIDQCAEYARLGIVPIRYKYGGRDLGPAYHPRCRCGLRLVFPEELNGRTIKTPQENPVKPVAPTKPKFDRDSVLGPIQGLKKDSIEVAGRDGSRANFALTKAEHNLIESTRLKVLIDDEPGPRKLKGNVQGVYSPSSHSLYLKVPSKGSRGYAYDHTFYHELGHAMDYRFTKGSATSTQMIAQLTKESTEVVVARLRAGGLDGEKLPDDIIRKIATGQTKYSITDKNGVVKNYSVSRRFINYTRSRSEVFADAYAQYRVNKIKFKEYAPQISKAFEEMGL